MKVLKSIMILYLLITDRNVAILMKFSSLTSHCLIIMGPDYIVYISSLKEKRRHLGHIRNLYVVIDFHRKVL